MSALSFWHGLSPEKLAEIEANRDLFEALVAVDLSTVDRVRFCHALAPKPSILEPITTTELRALSSFTAADHYTENTPDGVKLGGIGQNFRRLLETDGGQTVDVPDMKVRVDRLTADATTAAIVAAVGDSGRFSDFATAAAAMWAKLAEQPISESGDLLLNGFANIFPYPEGAVLCFWDGDYVDWLVEAYPVSRPYEWPAGGQVFSLADSH